MLTNNADIDLDLDESIDGDFYVGTDVHNDWSRIDHTIWKYKQNQPEGFDELCMHSLRRFALISTEAFNLTRISRISCPPLRLANSPVCAGISSAPGERATRPDSTSIGEAKAKRAKAKKPRKIQRMEREESISVMDGWDVRERLGE